jgi:predicted ATPase/class 3 adenylate cyclase
MRSDLPTGTVTFLFTDIQGSTRMLQQLGNRYARVEEEHAAIVYGAVESAGGVVVRTEGDSFFAAFSTPVQAIRAAVATQQGLASHEWSDGGPVRVRIGLHTGEGILGGGDYVGIDVNRAARVAAAAHGGQILISETTRVLVQQTLPERTTLRDLGEHRLKDIANPEHLYDLVIEGLPADFPPPATLEARPNNLPAQLTSFVGREVEIREVGRLLSRARLLTLTGPGGTGKSRLALQLAAETLGEYTDGSYFVDLSRVTDPAMVLPTLARALGIPDMGTGPILTALRDHLAGKQQLLILDNFEQVAEAGPAVEELLAEVPKLTVLVTSRVALGLPGEHQYPVQPLDPPDPSRLPDLPTLCRFEAVRLFTERALAVAPRFRVTEENASAVAEITARLDGLPLAIELAATQTRVLSPREIAARLDERLPTLGSRSPTVPERQRTLQGAISWSYDLLADAERRLLAQLSVFVGGWTLGSAEAVFGNDGLGADLLDLTSSLVDKSLVRRAETRGESRFTMLETIREFGREQLMAQGEEVPSRRRHAEHFLGLALDAEPHLEREPEWLDRCEREHDNLRAALQWAIDAGEADRAQEAAGALWRFWQLRGHLTEARFWFDEVLAMGSGQDHTAARAKALTGAGGIAWWSGDVPATSRFYEKALTIERELGDPTRIAEALYNLAFPLAGPENIEAPRDLLEESLAHFQAADDESGSARVLTMLALGDALAGDWNNYVARTEDAVAIWRRIGDRFHLADDLVALAFAYNGVGRNAEARSAALEALDLGLELDNPLGIGGALLALAAQGNREGRHQDAIRLIGAVESITERVGGGPPMEFMMEFIGDPEAEARAHLPKEEATSARDEGRAMTVKEAVTLARAFLGGNLSDVDMSDKQPED